MCTQDCAMVVSRDQSASLPLGDTVRHEARCPKAWEKQTTDKPARDCAGTHKCTSLPSTVDSARRATQSLSHLDSRREATLQGKRHPRWWLTDNSQSLAYSNRNGIAIIHRAQCPANLVKRGWDARCCGDVDNRCRRHSVAVAQDASHGHLQFRGPERNWSVRDHLHHTNDACKVCEQFKCQVDIASPRIGVPDTPCLTNGDKSSMPLRPSSTSLS